MKNIKPPRIRTIVCGNEKIDYLFERKSVKNLNLRVYKDCRVYVSANHRIPVGKVDEFVISKANVIKAAQEKFAKLKNAMPSNQSYMNGDVFLFLGTKVILKVISGIKNEVAFDGSYIYLRVKDLNDFSLKQRLVDKYFDERCKTVFGEIVLKTYQIFNSKYGVTMPTIKYRKMRSRWGSCMVNKRIITLNKHLVKAPIQCIEYVIMHEFCHFIHPNHSKNFYLLLAKLMPDWKLRKALLNQSMIIQ